MRMDRYKVRQRMNRVGIRTFTELAEMVGVTPQTVSGWFAKRIGFNSETLERLCTVLKCTANDVLTYDDPPKEPRQDLKKKSRLLAPALAAA